MRWPNRARSPSIRSATVTKRNSSPGRARRKPLEPFACGNAGCSGGLVVTTVCLLPMHTGRGCSGHPAFPAQWFYGLCHAPRRRIHLATVISGNGFALPGRAEQNLRRFSISNGCQDHTTSPSAATSATSSTGHVLPAKNLAKALKRRSSAQRPFAHKPKLALRLPTAPALPRPPHPNPRS